MTIITKYALYLLMIFIILLLASGIIILSLGVYAYVKEMIEEIKETEK